MPRPSDWPDEIIAVQTTLALLDRLTLTELKCLSVYFDAADDDLSDEINSRILTRDPAAFSTMLQAPFKPE